MKAKACRYCKKSFIPRNSKHILCSEDCAIQYANKQASKREVTQAKEARKEIAQKKQALKTRSDWLKDAQKVFNAWIRKRDEKCGCISCDKPATWQGQWHASHLHSVGSHPELRFNEDNVWKACSVCNNHLSGNLLEYKKRLIEKIGIERVNALEGKYKPAKYTIDEIKAIILLYKQKLKDFER